MKPHAADPVPLCVDFESALLKTDLLIEGVLSLLARSPLLIFRVLFWLFIGRAELRRQVFRRVTFDYSQIPLHQEVVDFLASQRAEARQILLCADDHAAAAQAFADFVGLFDRVIVADRTKGGQPEYKTDLLVDLLGENGFDYLCDERKKNFFVQSARRIYLIKAKTKSKIDPNKTDSIDILHYAIAPWKSLIKTLRPHQWVKNTLVFLPAFSAHAFYQFDILMLSLGAFLSFCAISSCVYIINDLFDLKSDRNHKSKRKRPIAANDLPLFWALATAPALMITSFTIASFVSPELFSTIFVYFLMNIIYTARIKRVVLLDVVFLSGFYTIRVLGGSEATEIELSFWLISFSTFLFLSLALAKRYSELSAVIDRGRAEIRGRGYRAADIETLSQIGIASGFAAALVLALYINSDDVSAIYARPDWMWGGCVLFLYWIMRAWIITRRGEMNEDPVVFALSDLQSYGIFFLITFIVVLAI